MDRPQIKLGKFEATLTKTDDLPFLSQDVRPPFTYAALIRQVDRPNSKPIFFQTLFQRLFLSNIFLLQAINESRGRQLTLNEIYNWFQVRQRHRDNTIYTFTSTESLKAPFSCLRQILRSSVVTPPLGK